VASEIAHELALHFNQPDAASQIQAANQLGIGSSVVQAALLEKLTELGSSHGEDIGAERKEWPALWPATPGCAVWLRCGLGCPHAKSRQSFCSAVTVLPAHVAR